MEWFEGLFQLPWGTIIISIAVILLSIKFVWELIEWFMKKFKIETGSMREKRKTHELLEDNSKELKRLSKVVDAQAEQLKNDHKLLIETSKGLKNLKDCEEKDVEKFKNNRIHDREQSFEIQRQLTEAIDKINTQLTVMQKESVEREVADIRWEILKMGTDVSNGKVATREQYDYIARLYDRYEVLLEQLGQENGLITETVKFLRESYQETLRKGIKKA